MIINWDTDTLLWLSSWWIKKVILSILAALRAARFASVCKGSWLSMALGLAMIVLGVHKNLKPTQFYLLNKLCYNNFAQNLCPVG